MKKQRSSTPSFHLDLRHLVSAVILLTVLTISFFIGRNLDSPSVGARPIDETRPTSSVLGVDVASLREAERIRNGFYAAILREAEHISKSVTTDGAINMVPVQDPNQGAYIIPYFAVYASIGLDVAAFLMREKEPQMALEYLHLSENFYYWYVAHMNPDGSIYDYTEGTVGNPQSSGDADSEDAYAGMFIHGAYVHYRVTYFLNQTHAQEFLNYMQPYLTKAASLIVSLQQLDGLTIAKRTYRMEYHMDNLEVYDGLRALVKVGVSGYEANTEKVASAINAYMWIPDSSYFAWARSPSGTLHSGWEKFYPEKLANTWATRYSLIGEEKRDLVYNKLMREYSNPKSAYSKIQTSIVHLAISALVQGDNVKARAYLNEMIAHEYPQGGFPEHGYTHMSGWFIVAGGLYTDWSNLSTVLLN